MKRRAPAWLREATRWFGKIRPRKYVRRMPPLLKGNQSQRMMPRGRQSNNVAEAACVTRMDAPGSMDAHPQASRRHYRRVPFVIARVTAQGENNWQSFWTWSEPLRRAWIL